MDSFLSFAGGLICHVPLSEECYSLSGRMFIGRMAFVAAGGLVALFFLLHNSRRA